MESVEHISCLKVKISNVSLDQLPELLYNLLETGESHHIVLLSLWDLLRARKNNDYRAYVQSAALVIPISKSIVGGVRFLTGKTIHRVMPFEFFIKTLTALEERQKSVYLLGSHLKSLKTAERNLKHTFPRLRIVGRCTGDFKRTEEATILTAIRKASPSLLLAARGIPGQERWLARNKLALGPGIKIWCSDLFDVFAERKHRPGKKTFDRGFEWIGYTFHNPLHIFRIFPYLYYKFLLLYYKLFRRG
ncbi:WecB/TagA/CpsF family glycosyltransferase [Gracilinema caldarium]|uniref:Glycosyl transferase, WecB/TagA/CpsF family n=1 Tax=Gracilinema caldarium (strain ATCC 51460 / DSM 7334 / H1) TaxID=744872 RepID=F8EYH3_GRAC1|nr:WecB/TagA/CpsF family glycosyltransferase [Gracilinema caldarium]AEJ18405.1 glycosyl transferase, WecB/TagA/CpsF family [Gracilinema caldarium DSM 7334]